MLSFVLNSDASLARVTEEHPRGETYINRNDFRTFEQAEAIAASATKLTGEAHVATDAGPYRSPRYDVIKMHRVGDPVSFSFNGDSYPCGTIESISPSLKVITSSDGRRFHRVGQTGSWRQGGTWFLTRGHVSKWNPSF